MTDTEVTERQLEPFSYFPTHASAIMGMGGNELAPDPRYCFHTPYYSFLTGTVTFFIRLVNCHSTEGELSVRIHAYRPPLPDVSLVAANQLDLTGIEGQDMVLKVRISAIPGVHYAAYGLFTEHSNLRAETLAISAVELGDEDPSNYATSEAGRSEFAGGDTPRSNYLVSAAEPSFAAPRSQPCTPGQLSSHAYRSAWPELAIDLDDEPARWSRAFALQALQTHGMMKPGARGLLFDRQSEALPPVLAGYGCHVLISERPDDMPAPSNPNVQFTDIPLPEISSITRHFDFQVSIGTLDRCASLSEVNEHLSEMSRCLLRGGIGVYIFDYWPTSRPFDGDLPFLPSKDDISRLAMRIIGHGSDIAQLCFPASAIEAAGPEPFGLIVRR